MSLVCDAHEMCQCMCKCKVCSKHVHVCKRVITAHNRAGIHSQRVGIRTSIDKDTNQSKCGATAKSISIKDPTQLMPGLIAKMNMADLK